MTAEAAIPVGSKQNLVLTHALTYASNIVVYQSWVLVIRDPCEHNKVVIIEDATQSSAANIVSISDFPIFSILKAQYSDNTLFNTS